MYTVFLSRVSYLYLQVYYYNCVYLHHVLNQVLLLTNKAFNII